jgi:branched-chain amino acid transport system ATP-binding protein
VLSASGLDRRLLDVQGLTKSFGGLAAVKGLTFSVREGEIVGFIGPNGSGKTTAFNLITGLLAPDAGHIWLAGEEITAFRPHAICAKGIARTFQLVKPFAHLSALHNVMVGAIYGREPVAALATAASQARETLAFVGLAGKDQVEARRLTLVDRKRLELARALATRPRLLLLDEFMAGLNPQEVQTAMALVRRIRETGPAVVMIEHIVTAVMGVSDRVIVLSAGQAIADGPPEAVARDPKVIDAYLGGVGVA